MPRVALGEDAPVHELDRADVEPARRLRGDEQLGVAPELAREDELLLVAAGEVAREHAARRACGRRSRDALARHRRRSRAGCMTPRVAYGALAVVAEDEVLGEVELEHEPAAVPVLGDVRDARLDRRRAPARA